MKKDKLEDVIRKLEKKKFYPVAFFHDGRIKFESCYLTECGKFYSNTKGRLISITEMVAVKQYESEPTKLKRPTTVTGASKEVAPYRREPEKRVTINTSSTQKTRLNQRPTPAKVVRNVDTYKDVKRVRGFRINSQGVIESTY